MPNLVLHAILAKKPYYKTRDQALKEAHHMFPNEKSKSFVRETDFSFRVRIVPKTKFIKTEYITKVINPNLSLVFGKLKN
jgi:hypothetical protein